MLVKQCVLAFLAIQLLSPAVAGIDAFQFTNDEQEQRFFTLTNEIRCPRCQNQTIADSYSPIANDLRREIHKMLQEGSDDQKIIAFLLDRYGDFILYRPRLNSKTAVLWLGPFALLLIAFFALIVIIRLHKNNKNTESSEDQLTREQQQKLKELTEEKALGNLE